MMMTVASDGLLLKSLAKSNASSGGLPADIMMMILMILWLIDDGIDIWTFEDLRVYIAWCTVDWKIYDYCKL